jgi:hypothetical protein
MIETAGPQMRRQVNVTSKAWFSVIGSAPI